MTELPSGKVPFATQVDSDVVDDVRATVAGLQRLYGPGTARTMTSFVTAALSAAVRQAQLEHNNGQPFPTTLEQLPKATLRSSGR